MNDNSSQVNNIQENPFAEIHGLDHWLSVVKTCRACDKFMRAKLCELGLSLAQYDVLACLLIEDGLSQQELARRNFVVKSNMSGLVRHMTEKGWLERRQDEQDARAHRIFLTPPGRKLGLAGVAVQKEIVELMIGAIAPEEAERISKSCREIQTALYQAYGDTKRHNNSSR